MTIFNAFIYSVPPLIQEESRKVPLLSSTMIGISKGHMVDSSDQKNVRSSTTQREFYSTKGPPVPFGSTITHWWASFYTRFISELQVGSSLTPKLKTLSFLSESLLVIKMLNYDVSVKCPHSLEIDNKTIWICFVLEEGPECCGQMMRSVPAVTSLTNVNGFMFFWKYGDSFLLFSRQVDTVRLFCQ